MSKKEWRSAIEKELQKKGFNRKAAKITANKTMRKSIAKRRLEDQRKYEIPHEYKPKKHVLGAIHQPNPLLGKVVVVTPGTKG